MILMQTPNVDLNALATVRGEPCLSFYLPTGAADSNPAQGRIRLKNMLREAETRVKEWGVRNGAIKAALEKTAALGSDEPFWAQSGRGFALFVSKDTYERVLLPEEVPEKLVITDRFHLAPLLPILNGNFKLYLLKISRDNPKLYLVTRTTIDEVESINLPKNMEDALHEEDIEELNYHGTTPKGLGTGGFPGSGAVYHGHAGGKENEKDKYLRYCRIVDHIVHDFLKDRTEPLMLNGVEYETAIYREVNTHPHLLDEHISGKPEDITLAKAHARAMEVLEPQMKAEVAAAIDRFSEMKALGRGSNDLGEIVAAAANGRVEFLIMSTGTSCWGRFDEATQKIESHDEKLQEDFDLLDFAAVQTFQNGGHVYVVGPNEVPGASSKCPIAAAYRY